MAGELGERHERFLVGALDLVGEDRTEYRVDALKLMERTDLDAEEFSRTLEDLENAGYVDRSTPAAGAHAEHFWLTITGVRKAKELRSRGS